MITSTSNAKIKNIISLMNKSRHRSKQGTFVIEGIRMFMEAPADRIVEVYVLENSPAFNDIGVKYRLQKLRYEIVTENVFKTITGTVTPQGILAVVKMQEYSLKDIVSSAGKQALFVVLEDIQDPGNLGTIMRTAEATGVNAIVMSKGTVDIYNPKVIRSTMGTVFRVPFIYTDDLCDTISYMKRSGIKMIAAHLKGAKWYDEINYCKSTAFMIGNEGNGLSDAVTRLADVYMKIPMEGQVESLNAAVASSVLMYEAYRQKRALK